MSGEILLLATATWVGACYIVARLILVVMDWRERMVCQARCEALRQAFADAERLERARRQLAVADRIVASKVSPRVTIDEYGIHVDHSDPLVALDAFLRADLKHPQT